MRRAWITNTGVLKFVDKDEWNDVTLMAMRMSGVLTGFRDHPVQTQSKETPQTKPKWSELLVAQLCPILCNPMDCSPPGSSVLGIFQARILEWVAISFSRESSQPRDWTQVSCTAGRLFTDWSMRENQTQISRHVTHFGQLLSLFFLPCIVYWVHAPS